MAPPGYCLQLCFALLPNRLFHLNYVKLRQFDKKKTNLQTIHMIVKMLPLLFALIISSFRFLIIFRRSVYWLEAKNAILPLQILCAVIFFFLKHSPCSNLNTVYLIDDPSLLLLQENGHDEISIKAMGRAINKTVMVVELIKVGLSSLVCLTILLLKFL